MLTYAAACELEATEAKQQVVLGDGADWIKTQASEHFPDAVKILDWPHLWRNMRDAVRAVQPGKRAARRAWRKEQWQKQGYPVGSGLLERAVAVAINTRMKKRGMRWKRANATAVVALHVQRINADWEAAAA